MTTTGEKATEVTPTEGDGGLLVMGPVFGGAQGNGDGAVATLSGAGQSIDQLGDVAGGVGEDDHHYPIGHTKVHDLRERREAFA